MIEQKTRELMKEKQRLDKENERLDRENEELDKWIEKRERMNKWLDEVTEALNQGHPSLINLRTLISYTQDTERIMTHQRIPLGY